MRPTIRADGAKKAVGSVLSASRQYAAAAAPQVLGLIVQILIIKVFFASSAAKTLSAYQFAVTISSILYLGLAYQQTFIKIRRSTVVLVQIMLFLAAGFASYSFDDRYFATLCLYLSYFLTISLIQYTVLRALNGNLYITVSAVISVVSPQLLWIGEMLTFVLAGALIFLFLRLNGKDGHSEKNENNNNLTSLGSVAYSILLQSPLLMLALFDPLLAAVVGPSFYVNFVILQKITNGISLLAFSRIQLKIVLKQYRISNFVRLTIAFILISVISAVADIVSVQHALLIRCILLSLNINFASIVIRDHLQWGKQSPLLLAISVGAVLTYGAIIYACFYFGWTLFDAITLMITMITVPTLCVMVTSHRRLRVSEAVPE